ncbi:Na+/H+ antiporter NhaC family protein [Paenibacillus sp. UMB4589-SE434]|uniref:Na+/H+ antiporter family protein n=1 Tax=Paenibacillus sp. UMB4589-SE434 TaxID=3046314 RepID=UPI00254FC883|nr:Na+/H+ antiporter NhaC family protein [Paenibacillus sp. UMB4589-SE434]MDK8181514.1 Na+/H+ antiporter NhaC family protein [Paenibacillus sp. UMB4589-SE434]
MNAVLLSIAILFALSLCRVHIVMAMLISAVAAGLAGGLGVTPTIDVFTEGLKDNASIALSYALLGAFAAALTETGLPERIVHRAGLLVGRKQAGAQTGHITRFAVVLAIAFMACLSQNVVPVHIAFIPVLIPPLLGLFNSLHIDRRAIANALTFGLIMPYMLIPVGFGAIFHETVASNMTQNGLQVDASMLPRAMLIPAMGMIAGLLIATFLSYRKARNYSSSQTTSDPFVAGQNASIQADTVPTAAKKGSTRMTIAGLLSIAVMLTVQLSTGSMIYGAGAGLAILLLAKIMPRDRSDRVFSDGMRSMAYIGFVMMSAAGFGAVLRATGDIESLVQACASFVGDNRAFAAILMLAIGLLVTLGIGSSFSTIPLIATVFVPLAMKLGFSPLATVSLIGTAAALGDAGSPASDSTLGPTAGLNADGHHDHIWDTCVPTFLHYNVPLLIFGFIAAMLL